MVALFKVPKSIVEVPVPSVRTIFEGVKSVEVIVFVTELLVVDPLIFTVSIPVVFKTWVAAGSRVSE